MLSNSLKFTLRGGHIIIKCKLIQNYNDISFKELEGIKNIFESSDNCILELIVQDTGVGIDEKDQKKLFKLFGSID